MIVIPLRFWYSGAKSGGGFKNWKMAWSNLSLFSKGMGFFVLALTNSTNHACVPCLRRSGFAQAGVTAHSGVQARITKHDVWCVIRDSVCGKRKGYSIHLFFLWIKDVKLALERIELRVQQGGHSIPEATVRRRFRRGIFNFFHEYQPIVDSWVIFDNSEDIPQMIAFKESGKLEILDPALFNMLLKHKDPKWKRAGKSIISF